MAHKQIAVRLDQDTIDQLKARSSIEKRPVNDIITTAIHEYSQTHPVSREDMLRLVRAIAKEDAALLEALAKA